MGEVSLVRKIVSASLEGVGVPLATRNFASKESFHLSFFGNKLIDYLLTSHATTCLPQALELAEVLLATRIIFSASPRDSFADGRFLYYINQHSSCYAAAVKSIEEGLTKSGEDTSSNDVDSIPLEEWFAFADSTTPKGALSIYNLLLKRDNLPGVYVLRAETYMVLNDLTKALQDVQVAIERDPTIARGYLLRSRIYSKNDRRGEAIRDAKKVLELEPTNTEAQAMLKSIDSTYTSNTPVSSPRSRSMFARRRSVSTPAILVAPPVTIKSSPVGQDELELALLSTSQKWHMPYEFCQRLQNRSVGSMDCREKFCSAARMDMDYIVGPRSNSTAVVLREAKEWLEQYYKERNLSKEKFFTRMNEVADEIKAQGTYWQTYDELAYGAKVAWRNASRCINRIQWNRMEVIDCRQATTSEEIFKKCIEHLRFATNRGNIITTMTVFAPPSCPGKPGPRLWNSQLLRYAGYQQPNGTVIGDPINLELTEAIQKLGWVGEGTMFDILPLVIQMPGEDPKVFSIPPEDVLLVHMSHPSYVWFEELNLQWVSVPLVSNIALTCGGIQYSCTPFNGWFMGTEVARNLGDPQRYNVLPKIASMMGLDTNGPSSSLWQEKANIELNIAVLYSFQKARVSVVDHHTAAAGFMAFWETEHALGRPVPADWIWLNPPCSGSVSPLFHLEMINWLQKPAYYPQTFPGKDYTYPTTRRPRHTNLAFKTVAYLPLIMARFMKAAQDRRHRVTVLFATETGNSERYARRIGKFLCRTAAVSVRSLGSYETSELEKEEVVIFVASTFGNGDAPTSGANFQKQLVADQQAKLKIKSLQYAVFALGSTLYPHFAAFGQFLDERLSLLGASRVTPLVKGDEIAGSELAYKKWIGALWASLCPMWGFAMGVFSEGLSFLGLDPSGVDTQEPFKSQYKLVPCQPTTEDKAPSDLPPIYNRKNPFPASLKENMELFKEPDPTGERSTRKIVLDLGLNPIKFSPGDHLAVLPSNMPELVEDLLAQLNLQEDVTCYTLQPLIYDSAFDIPLAERSFTLREAFTNYLDITSPPKPELLSIFAHFAFHPGDKALLQDLAKGMAAYETWVQHHLPTLPQFLKLFPISVPLPLLLEKLPQLHPRFYSISSSPKLYPSEVHLTVSVVHYTSPSGEPHHGVASTFLARSSPGTTIHAFVHPADFALPPSPTAPIILVGPGTGIAPFRGFWQERLLSQEPLGSATLFFGCRHSEIDFIYQGEIEEALEKGALSDVAVAFSRDGPVKEYVQDRIMEESEHVWELLNDGAYFYVCGDVTMSRDVEDTVKQIAQGRGGMGILESAQFVEDLKLKKRYLTDVFGPTLHVQQQLTEVKDHAMNSLFKTSLASSLFSTIGDPLASRSPSSLTASRSPSSLTASRSPSPTPHAPTSRRASISSARSTSSLRLSPVPSPTLPPSN